jgi:hypothetical protein
VVASRRSNVIGRAQARRCAQRGQQNGRFNKALMALKVLKNGAKVFPRLSRRKVLQRTDALLGLVFSRR